MKSRNPVIPKRNDNFQFCECMLRGHFCKNKIPHRQNLSDIGDTVTEVTHICMEGFMEWLCSLVHPGLFSVS
jgi:hypothetical protein